MAGLSGGIDYVLWRRLSDHRRLRCKGRLISIAARTVRAPAQKPPLPTLMRTVVPRRQPVIH
jgi:hypothetical protein